MLDNNFHLAFYGSLQILDILADIRFCLPYIFVK
nr:MAG TPA: hypothetical protein [Caudoviricetes sp.]